MPNRNGTGPSGMGPMTDSTGSRQAGRGAGLCGRGNSRSGQSNNSDWLVGLVGTAVLALGSIVFRALTRKMKSSSGKDAKTEREEKSED